jgi:c-di-GMP-binding flagellar brake protein YcgR
MSVITNPDRRYVTREYRAKIQLAGEALQGSPASPHNVILPGLGAALVNLSMGGCCLRIVRSDSPFNFHPDHQFPSIKLLHPGLESSPIRGRVAWSREEPPHLLIGVQFLLMQKETRTAIQSYLGVGHPPES